VPALTAKGAAAKMRKGKHREANLLAETPSSTLSIFKKQWEQNYKPLAVE
jgi:hypothetical protein